MKSKHTTLYFFILTLISFLTYYKVLDFAFWRDDWVFYWGAIQNDKTFLTLLFHPGTMIEFYVLSRVLGQHTMLWNVWGIGLKIFASFTVYTFISALTSSKKAGKIAGILFSVIPLGLEAVAWAAAHVALVNVIFVCLSCTYFIRYQKTHTKTHLILFLVFAFLSFVSDPIRTSAVCLMVPIWLVLYKKKKHIAWSRLVALSVCIALLCIAVAVFLSKNMLADYLVVRAVKKHGLDLLFYIRKTIFASQNYFSSIGNILIGPFVPTVNDIRLSSSYQHIVSGIAGGIALVSIPILGYFRKKNKENVTVVLFLLLWVLLFYVPNWIFTLQLTVGFTNRYTVLSGVGLVGLMAYGISLLSTRWVRIIVLSGLVIFFWIQNHYILSVNQEFRSLSLHNQLYARMQREVPKPFKQYLLMITGDHPAVPYSLLYNMQVPLVMSRNIPQRSQFPIFVDTIDRAVSYICGKTTMHSAAWQFIPVPIPPEIKDVFAWNVHSDGTIESVHEEIRSQIQQKIQNEGCEYVIPLKPL